MKWMLGVLSLLACEGVTSPVYLVGEASFTVINRGTMPVLAYRSGDSMFTLQAGDSLCRHFHADGNWQTVVVWSDGFTPLMLQWAPEPPVYNVTLWLWDREFVTETTETLC